MVLEQTHGKESALPRDYELMVILQPQLEDEGVNSFVGQLGDLVGRLGGAVRSAGQLADRRGNVQIITEGWKARRLSYAIKRQRSGYYVVARLLLPGEQLTELDRSLRLNEAVLRHIILTTNGPAGGPPLTTPSAPAATAPSAPAATAPSPEA